MVVDDANLRKLFDLGNVKRGLISVRTQRSGFVRHLVVEDRANLAEVSGNEGFRLNRVGLHQVAGADNDVVHGNHNALLSRFLCSGRQNSVVKVTRAVSTETGGGEHGANEHHRLLALDGQVEEVSGFFHRVRAVRDHKAVDLTAISIDGLGELEPHVVGHILGTDLNNLLGSNLSNVSELRYSGNQMVDAYLTGGVSRTRCRIAGTGNRATCGEHFNLRQRGGHSGTASGSDSSSKQRLLNQAHFCFSLSKKCFGKYSHARRHQ